MGRETEGTDPGASEISDVKMETEHSQPKVECHTPPPSPSAHEKLDGLRAFR